MTQNVGKPSKHRAKVRVQLMQYMIEHPNQRLLLERIAHDVQLNITLVKHEIGLLASAKYLVRHTEVNGDTKLRYQYNDRCRSFDFNNPEQALWGKGDRKGLKIWRVHPSALVNITPGRLEKICSEHEPCEVY